MVLKWADRPGPLWRYLPADSNVFDGSDREKFAEEERKMNQLGKEHGLEGNTAPEAHFDTLSVSIAARSQSWGTFWAVLDAD